MCGRKGMNRIFRSTFSSVEKITSVVNSRIAKWVLVRKGLKDQKVDDLLSNWEACLSCGMAKQRKLVLQTAASIGGALRSSGGDLLVLFSNPVGMKDSNEAEVLAILEALPIFFPLFPTAAHGGE